VEGSSIAKHAECLIRSNKHDDVIKVVFFVTLDVDDANTAPFPLRSFLAK